MTVRFTTGDLFRGEAEALVNPVNCVGVMGAGLALEFRTRWPSNFDAYRNACAAGSVRIGMPHVHVVSSSCFPRVIVNLPTKNHWRDPSQLSFVADGVLALARLLPRLEVRSIAIPALGCGLGGLDWCDVRPLLESAFAPMLDVDAVVYEPV